MEASMKVQLDLACRIKKTYVNFKKSSKERLNSVDHLNAKLEILQKLWNQFESMHTEMVREYDSAQLNASPYMKTDVYGEIEDIFVECKAAYKSQLRSLTESTSKLQATPENGSSNSTGNQQVRLPKISIPPFAGNYAEWISFKDLFTSLVHNNPSLDSVQKLHYLKGHLTGEAEQLLRHIPITQDNYQICWDTLEKRYNNKRYLSTCIMKRFFSQRNMTTESAGALKELLDTSRECLHSLKNLGIDVSSWDIIVIHILCLKLDTETRKQWELKVSESAEDLPTYSQFEEFLETKFRALEFMDPKLVKSNVTNKGGHNNVSQSNNPKMYHVTAPPSCTYCSESHKIAFCREFAKLETDNRRDYVQSNNLCFNCLNQGHSVFSCRQPTRCRICKKKHHSLLHPKSHTIPTESNVESDHSVEENVVAHVTHPSSSHNELCHDEATDITTCFSTSRSQVLLATALVKAQSRTGAGVTVRCLLDQGSQASFITEATAQLLGLKKVLHKSTISGLGSDKGTALVSKSIVQVNLQSLHDPNFVVGVQAFVLSKLTSILPERRVVVELRSEFADLNLADPTFDTPNKIDMLLGADVYGQVLLEGMIKGPVGTPIAQRTKFGWILSGPVLKENTSFPNKISVNHVQVNENDLLKRFWEIENDSFVVDSKKHYTEEEMKCEEVYAATTERDSSGRYIVRLPFRDPNPKCAGGNSEAIAAKRLSFLEKKLDKNPNLKSRYTDVLKEYIQLGHMVEVSSKQNKDKCTYLPHHAVVREDKSTTKVRAVFDASCKNSNGVSLNDTLMIGPTLQPDLRHLVMKWRQFPVCLVADIVQMYRQILVHENDTDYQRILWRGEPQEAVKHYKLLRVTFGTAAAPYLAVRTLHQVAYDEGKKYPLAEERVLSHFYMDDLLTGCETIEEGRQVYKQLNEMLKRGGFELQKWSSNSEKLMEEITEEKRELKGNVELKIDNVMKILGLTWNRSSDEFEYAVQLPPMNSPVTKRSVISDISRLFDPLGWLAPVIISAKIFIQKLWLSGIDWDDELPSQLLKEWLNYRQTLSQLTKFKLPRWTHTSTDVETVELQGFSDASEDAYAAVVYVRVVDLQGNVHVSLVTSKTKVAPIKKISVPRLELCGAGLLTKLLMEVAKVMNVSKLNIHAWTDSSIVLAWLNSHPSRWKTFVANRASEILTSLEPNQWAHVSSKDNPADCASRGIQQFEDEQLWKEGPSWLKERIINYKGIVGNNTNLEERKSKICLLNTCDDPEDAEEETLAKFSTLSRLIRVLAYCKRFINRGRKNNIPDWLTSDELRDSLHTCIKITQEKHFKEELKNLKENKSINKKNNKLTKLSPFIDDSGILRVGGRLQQAEISESMKHPIILPEKSPLTKLIVAESHLKTLHGGPQLMLNYLRSRYWVVGARNLVKYFVLKCVRCVRYSAATNQPFMGQLPSSRATATRPFFHSGVDYAGPINMRTSKGRGHHAYKGYICLFVCMATRAIHLEAVSDLTSQGFLAAFKRFVARRGHCQEIWSDNGTNFVGAARELKQLFSSKSSAARDIAEQLATEGTRWHYIPPHSPNFGGLWEAGVKSTKHHLRRVVGDTTLTFEEMTTMLSQIEACLNSRPISQISQNRDDPMPLTPAHFLVGEPLVLIPDGDYTKSTLSSLKRWQLTQRMVQDFWQRWSREYLTQFHHRYKWNLQVPEPSVGSVVLVKEDDLPPSRWLYGLIVDKHTGLDGVTRVVSLKCKDKIIKRPVSKLCVLPVQN